MIRIVLADDHKIVREGVRRLLEEDCGFLVLGEAPDGIQALDMVAELKPDLLVTDLRMPKMDGVEVTRKVKESFPETEVIILSMYSAEVYVYSALSAGAKGYVLKEWGIEKLGTAIESVVNGRQYLSPPITRDAIETYIIKNDKPPLKWQNYEQ